MTSTQGNILGAAVPAGLEVPVVVPRENQADPQLIGRGRSGVVYRQRDSRGRELIRKVFVGEGLANLVMIAVSGAPNPYRWNRHAVDAAVFRRKVLRTLVSYWFGSKLQVPETHGAEWNEQREAFELRTDYIDGQHLPLRWCQQQREPDLLPELTRDIMRPLQRHLIEAGIDGMVWQAGLGNPVAGGNFMMRQEGDAARSWFWIDLESGVPALFPLNPLTLFNYYLPQARRYRRPMFDDVDVSKLRRYVADQHQQFESAQGKEALSELEANIDKLEDAQRRWKELGRTANSIEYFRQRKLVTEAEAEWYRERPWPWQLHALGLGIRSALPTVMAMLPELTRRWRNLDWPKLSRRTRTFFTSAEFRKRLADRYALGRIRAWRDRRFIGPEVARQLRGELREDHAGECVLDFGVHLAIKPAVKFVQWCLLPVLCLLGFVQLSTVVLVGIIGGSVARTAYTLYRHFRPSQRSNQRPWVALAVGVLPVVGSLAYPLQFACWCRDRKRRIAQFLLYDCFASSGRAVAIWGGENSLVEAWANRLPELWFSKFALARMTAANR